MQFFTLHCFSYPTDLLYLFASFFLCFYFSLLKPRKFHSLPFPTPFPFSHNFCHFLDFHKLIMQQCMQYNSERSPTLLLIYFILFLIASGVFQTGNFWVTHAWQCGTHPKRIAAPQNTALGMGSRCPEKNLLLWAKDQSKIKKRCKVNLVKT